MRRAYKFRIYPTKRQEGRLDECCRDHRALYNAALEERRGRWTWNRQSVRYGEQSAQLKEIRSACPEQGRWSFSSQQATLRRLDKAMEAFFRRLKTGASPGFPRFKGSERFDSVEWPKDGDGCRWKPDDRRVYLQGVGDMKVNVHRPVEGVVKTVTCKREGRRWYLVLSCDEVPAMPLPTTGREVGVDLGIAHFLTTSDGEVVANPKFRQSSEAELVAAQQVLARKRRGSKNRGRARARVAEVHRRVRNRRADFHHKVARRLIDSCDVLAFEDLPVSNMSRSASGTLEEPGTNVAAKRGLNRSIHDAGWTRFLGILVAKDERKKLGDGSCSWTPATQASPATTAANDARVQGGTPWNVRGAGPATPTSTGHETSQPGPGWALVEPLRLEKPLPSGSGAVTGTGSVPTNNQPAALRAVETTRARAPGLG